MKLPQQINLPRFVDVESTSRVWLIYAFALPTPPHAPPLRAVQDDREAQQVLDDLRHVRRPRQAPRDREHSEGAGKADFVSPARDGESVRLSRARKALVIGLTWLWPSLLAVELKRAYGATHYLQVLVVGTSTSTPVVSGSTRSEGVWGILALALLRFLE